MAYRLSARRRKDEALTGGEQRGPAPQQAGPSVKGLARLTPITGPIALVVGIVLVGILAFLVGVLGHPSQTTSSAAAVGVVVLVPALAVGVERVLEVFWSLVDQLASSPFWPLNAPARELQDLSNTLDPIVQPLLEQAETVLAGWPQDPTKTGDQLKAAQAEVGALQQAAAAVANTPSSTIGLQNLKNALDRVDKVIDDPRVSGAVAAAAVGIRGISTSIGSLLDNPGRRVISLFLGSLIGLVVVWWLGLDVIHAALNAPLPTQPQDTTLSNLHTLQWGMVATGLIIGLGASPTHDLISAIQAYKQTQQQGS